MGDTEGPRLQSLIENEITRRDVLAAGAGGLLSLSAVVGALESLAAAPAHAQSALPPPSPAAVRATMTAFADSIVPGPAGRAHPRAGAVEAGVVDEIYDPFYGVADAFPLLHTDIQAATPRILARPVGFDLDLPYADRERVVLDRIIEAPGGGSNPGAAAYQAAGILVYLSFMGTPRSTRGPRAIGFPPSSDGYWPDHSYRVSFAGMTRDGNPR